MFRPRIYSTGRTHDRNSVWLLVGLIAGWLAGLVMKGGGYGVLVDIILGLVGGILGGWLSACWEFGREEA